MLVHESKTVKKPVFLTLIIVADIIIAFLIERKRKIFSNNPKEYYCKPSILQILIIMANIIFSIVIFVSHIHNIFGLVWFKFFSDSIFIDSIFVTIWYYCIDVYVFTYIYFNVPKRKYAIRYIKKMFKLQ